MQERRFERVAIRLSRELFGQLVSRGNRPHGLTLGNEFWCLSGMGQPGEGKADGMVYVLGMMRSHTRRSTYRYPAVLLVLDEALPFDDVVNHPRVKVARFEEIGRLFEVLRALVEQRKDEITGHDMIRMDIALADIEARLSEALGKGGAVEEPEFLIAPAKEAVRKRETVSQKRRVYRPMPGAIQYARAVADTDRFLKFCALAARAKSEVLVRVDADGKMRLSAMVTKKAKKKASYLKLEMSRVAAEMPVNLDVIVDPLVLANDVLRAVDKGSDGFVGINVFEGGVACTMVVPKDSRKAA